MYLNSKMHVCTSILSMKTRGTMPKSQPSSCGLHAPTWRKHDPSYKPWSVLVRWITVFFVQASYLAILDILGLILPFFLIESRWTQNQVTSKWPRVGASSSSASHFTMEKFLKSLQPNPLAAGWTYNLMFNFWLCPHPWLLLL